METCPDYDELPMDWVGDWIGRRAALTPHRPAVFDSATGQRHSYADLDSRANRAGAFLRDELRLEQGDRISFVSRNRVECLDLYFASGKLGLILAPLSHRLAAPELEGLLDRIQPSALFVDAPFADLVSGLRQPASIRETVILGDDPNPYRSRVLDRDAVAVNRPLRMNEPFLYVHTGGSTGVPKLCVVSHRQMIWNSFDLIATGSGGLGLEGKELVTFPFFHIGGWNTVTPIVHVGGQSILMREFNPDLALELIEREGVTHFGGVEAMFRMLSQSPRFASADLSSVRFVNAAGAPCSAEAMRPFWRKGVPLTQSYGLTEAGPSNFILLPDGLNQAEIEANSASIGGPMFHCDVKLADPETGLEAAAGETGEIWLRSPHGFDGYLGDEQKTRRARAEGGWIRSGDLARRDQRGRFSIVGRADNMFVSGGENIAPEEIEEVLRTHPAVLLAAVCGVPDPRWGKAGVALVVAAPGHSPDPDGLRTFCQQSLGRFKIPRQFHFVPQIPLTGAGKIDRRKLAEMAAGL